MRVRGESVTQRKVWTGWKEGMRVGKRTKQ